MVSEIHKEEIQMSKKVISLLLAVMLTAAMIVVAAISVSADTDDEGA